MFPLIGIFMVGIAGGVGAKVGTDVVYPWVKDKAEKVLDSCKGATYSCEEETVDFNEEK